MPEPTADSSLKLSGVNDLDNDDRVRVLAIIDQFRELGVNEDISLPQVSKQASYRRGSDQPC